MKRLSFIVFCLFAIVTAKADEGMWTLYNLPQQVYEQMKAEGLQMPYDQLYNSKSALKNAVVNFSGYCTGVVVSPDGLVFTNHHCGFEAIRSHSTVQNDYMLNGFYAKTQAEELPNQDMFVSFMVSQSDITNRISTPAFEKLGYDAKEKVIDSIENVLSDSVSKADSTMFAEVKPFYEGNKYYLTVYQTFRDLRLVFAPTKSIGKFGGETDNWMWPRQTCDFAVFRIYVNPTTGKPAHYSKDNVPYHPKHWAQVSLQGYKDGDFSMTVGYPGSTERYLSSYGIREMRDAQNAPRIQVRGIKQEVMLRHMRTNESVRIKYDSKFAQSSNYWKNSMGMNKCIDSIGIISQKEAYEKRIKAWVDSTGYLKDKLDLTGLKSLYERRSSNMKVLTYYYETFRNSNIFTTRAISLNRQTVMGPQDKPKKQYIIFPNDSDKWDASLDKEVLAALLKNYHDHVDFDYLPKFYTTIKNRFHNDYKAYVDYLFDKSIIMKSDEKLYINSKEYKKDPGVELGLDLLDTYSSIIDHIYDSSDNIKEQEKYLCAAPLRMEEDMPHYSDANFTMRLSYGQVGGYDLGGKISGYYTDAPSIINKMKLGENGNIDYQAEPIMKDILSSKDFGKYTDKTTGKFQLCFLTNNDITGGNSGSPMFDGKGRLIGLAFDGNWDSLSSDINFDRHLARCIGVDIRYVLYMIDKWGHADRLLKEINAK